MLAPVIAALQALTATAEFIAAAVLAVVVVMQGVGLLLHTLRTLGGGSRH